MRQPGEGRAEGAGFSLPAQLHGDDLMLLPTADRLMLNEKYSLPPKKQAMQCPRGSGEGKSEGISPVVFSESQFELHCIHQEVVEIMGNNGSPGLWTKSP